MDFAQVINICIECGKRNDAISPISTLQGSKYPYDAGDVSICWTCGHVAIFNDDLSLREPTVDEAVAIHNDPAIQSALAVRAEVIKEQREMKLTEQQIELAGKALKVIHLANTPGMDEVAIKLNCGLTYDEKRVAKRWARAFELATEGQRMLDIAATLNEEFRY